jgi:hypothetical protein
MRLLLFSFLVLFCCTPTTLPAADVTLSVGATSPGGRTLAYTWAVTSAPSGAALPAINQVGPTPGAGFSDTATASFSPTAMPGDYGFRVTVSDGLANATSDTTVSVRRAQNISFSPLVGHGAADADFTPGAIASSGLAVSYGSSDATVATIVNGKIHLIGPGTVTITATQAGNGTYAAATAVAQTLVVSLSAQTISFPALTSMTIGAADVALGASASSGLAVTYTSSNPAVATVVAGTLHLVGPGTATITASQPGNALYAAATAVGQTLTVAKRSQVITFPVLPTTATVGDPDLVPGATASSGLDIAYVSSNPAVAIIVAGKIHIVGAGSTTITATQPGNGTWDVAAPVAVPFQVAAAGNPIITKAAAASPDTLILP